MIENTNNHPSPPPNPNVTSGTKTIPSLIKKEQHIEHRVEFSGPLPPPEILAQYEKILPKAAERILAMAEKQSSHRQAMEQRIIYSETFQAKVGMFLAFILVISALIIGGYLSLNNHPVNGLVSIIIAIGIIVETFILKRNADKKTQRTVQPPPESKH